jgi:hypothetical protein
LTLPRLFIIRRGRGREEEGDSQKNSSFFYKTTLFNGFHDRIHGKTTLHGQSAGWIIDDVTLHRQSFGRINDNVRAFFCLSPSPDSREYREKYFPHIQWEEIKVLKWK